MSDLPTGEQLREQLEQALRAAGWVVYHDRSPRGNPAGLPDVICAHPRLGLWAVECKSRGERLRPEQQQWRDAAGDRWLLLSPETAVAVAGRLGLQALSGEWTRLPVTQRGLARSDPSRAREGRVAAEARRLMAEHGLQETAARRIAEQEIPHGRE